jgi:recombination protein RecT
MSNALAIIQGDIYAAKDGFTAVLTDRSINFEKEAGFAVQLLQSNDYLLKIGLSNRQSVVDAVTNVAAVGISLNPAKKQAYLVPRDGKVCLDISYMGLLDLAVASGSLKWGQAALVHEHDAFVLNGFDKPPTHNFNPFAKESDRGAVVGAYVVVKTCDGDFLTTTMSIDEINAIRDRSEAWKRGQKGPWKTDPGEMAKKTVIKRASKLWPKTARLDQAIHYLNTDGGEGLHFESAQQQNLGGTNIDVEPMIAAALKTKTDAEALAFWKENNAKLAGQPKDHKRLKEVIMAHRAKLQADADEKRTVDMQQQPPPPVAPQVDADFVAALDAAEDGSYIPE